MPTFVDWHNLVWLCPYSTARDYMEPSMTGGFCLFLPSTAADRKPRQNPTLSDKILRNPLLRRGGEIRNYPLNLYRIYKKTGQNLKILTGFWSRLQDLNLRPFGPEIRTNVRFCLALTINGRHFPRRVCQRLTRGDRIRCRIVAKYISMQRGVFARTAP